MGVPVVQPATAARIAASALAVHQQPAIAAVNAARAVIAFPAVALASVAGNNNPPKNLLI